MSLPLLFARRYLFAKRGADGSGRNAVNIITGISIAVITVVTAAMVIVLSTMNGINDLVDSLYSPFDQDLTITPVTGKTFHRGDLPLEAIKALPAVQNTSWTIEENVVLRAGDRRTVATMKGVEPQYLAMSRLPEHLYVGDAALTGPTGATVVLGAALKDQLAIALDDGVTRPLEIAAPIRGRKLSRYQQAAFERERTAVAGAFTINLDFDQRYVIVPLDLAAELLRYADAVNALEVHAAPGTDTDALAAHVRTLAGDRFLVRTRHQKNELMFRTNATEKWFTFLMLIFIGLIGAFNIIASLTVLMIEKRQDMRTLRGMGATAGFTRRVFFLQGCLIVAWGLVIGLVVGLLVCSAQQLFGLVRLQDGVVDSYPVKVVPSDLLLIVLAVGAIGLLASWLPLGILSRRYLQAAKA